MASHIVGIFSKADSQQISTKNMAINHFFTEEIATELLKKLIAIICKSCLCKSSAEGLISTINELLPIIQEIKYSGVELPPIRQVQLDRLSETLRDGLRLCNEVLSSAWWNVYKNFQLARKMEKLEKKVAKFLNGPMQAHVLADVLHMRVETAERLDRLAQRLGSILTPYNRPHDDLPARGGIS